MKSGLIRTQKRGVHYSLAKRAALRLASTTFALKGKNERAFEMSLVASLQTEPELAKNMITQIGLDEVEKIQRVAMFGFRHKPDVALGLDGTAIEVKLVRTSTDIQVAIGQSLMYRTGYRFAIMALVDGTPDRRITAAIGDPFTPERELLQDLAEINVLTVVGPTMSGGNLTFFPTEEEPQEEETVSEPQD